MRRRTERIQPGLRSLAKGSTSLLGPHSCVQRAPEAPAAVDGVISSPGRPLDASVRSFMEPRFGRDFGEVRIHTDQEAASSARAVHANAWALGNHIAFGAGQYAPEKSSGRRTLAHELAHVVQSPGPAPTLARQSIYVGDTADQSEAAADRAADAATGASPAPVPAAALALSPAVSPNRAVLRRQPLPPMPKKKPLTKAEKAEQERQQQARAEEEKEAAAWELAKPHFTPELLIKFQEIGRAALRDARNRITDLFAPYEKEVTTPDTNFLNIFLGGAGNVPQGELGGFIGGAAAAGFQAGIQAILSTTSVAEVKERARTIPEDILVENDTNSPTYQAFEDGAIQDLSKEFTDWWDLYPMFHDDPGQIRVEANLLGRLARVQFAAGSPRGMAARQALLKKMEPGFQAIREAVQDLQDAAKRKKELGASTAVAAGIGSAVGGVVGGILGAKGNLGTGAGIAIGTLVGGVGLGGVIFGATLLKQAFTKTPKELREEERKRAKTEEEKKDEAEAETTVATA